MSKTDETNELRKLIIENPTMPIVFCCSSDELGEYAWTFYEDFSCEVVTIYQPEGYVFDHIVDITEYYEEMYDNEDISEEEFKKKVQEAVENTPQYKAIRVFCK